MNLNRNKLCGFGIIVIGVTVMAASNMLFGIAPDARAESPSQTRTTAQPVEDNMHEFMEYVFQPTYKRLKEAMASEPTDNGAWKAIKSDALILAESGNLLLIRKPKELADVWTQHSVVVRELGGNLYQAARKKDYESARRNYTSMLTKCNSCHDKFADGEHQLKP
jgi:cytochrome c553